MNKGPKTTPTHSDGVILVFNIRSCMKTLQVVDRVDFIQVVDPLDLVLVRALPFPSLLRQPKTGPRATVWEPPGQAHHTPQQLVIFGRTEMARRVNKNRPCGLRQVKAFCFRLVCTIARVDEHFTRKWMATPVSCVKKSSLPRVIFHFHVSESECDSVTCVDPV